MAMLTDKVLGELGEYGFKLVESGDHTLELYFKDKRIAQYNQDKVTSEIIKENCKSYLKAIARWRGYEND